MWSTLRKKTGERTFPRVSGMQKKVKAKARRQKAAKKMYVPQVMDSSISGVTRPMMLQDRVVRIESISLIKNAVTYKLHIHVAEVVIEMALDLMERLKISEGRTQPIGADSENVVSWLLENEGGKRILGIILPKE